jgi:hypothetical protein
MSYLTTEDFSKATGYKCSSIYNMKCKGMFKEGVHYYKPSANKILFIKETVDLLVKGEIHRAFETEKMTESSGKLSDANPSKNSSGKPNGKSGKSPVVALGGLRLRLAKKD